MVDELEPLQEHAEHQSGLLQRELASDAGPLAGAEGLVGVVGIDARRSGAMCSGWNSCASSPQMDRSRCRAGISTVTAVFAGRAYLSPMTVSSRGAAGEHGGGRPEAERLVEHLADVREPVHLLERRCGGAAQHVVDLVTRPARMSGFLSR